MITHILTGEQLSSRLLTLGAIFLFVQFDVIKVTFYILSLVLDKNHSSPIKFMVNPDSA